MERYLAAEENQLGCVETAIHMRILNCRENRVASRRKQSTKTDDPTTYSREAATVIRRNCSKTKG